MYVSNNRSEAKVGASIPGSPMSLGLEESHAHFAYSLHYSQPYLTETVEQPAVEVGMIAEAELP
jgi:hypothetical protein